MGILYEQLNVTFPEQIQWGNIDNRGYANITAGFNNIYGPAGVGGTLSLVTKIGNTVNASGIYINNGNVEIGTSSLLSTFSVNGTTTLKNTLTITNSSLDRATSLVIDTYRAGIIFRSPSGSGGKEWNIWSSITDGCPYGGGAFSIYDNTSNLFRFSITSSGQVVMPAGNVLIGSNITITNDRISFASGPFYVLNSSSVGVRLDNGATSWASQSDERLKNIIKPIANALEKVDQLHPVIYSWKADNTNEPHPGLIAQDVIKVQPEAVSYDESSIMNVRYTELIPLAFAAIKELKQENENLKSQLKAIISEINLLK
jgi:hypothetical protein